MCRFAWILIFVLIAHAPAHAEEPSKSETKFLRALTNALGDESSDVVQAAQLGLDAMKGKAAWYLIRELRKFKGAKRDAAREVLIDLGRHTTDAVRAYGKLSTRMQDALKPVLAEIAEVKKQEEAKVAAPVPNATVDARVDAILAKAPANHWSSHSRITDSLVALGRPAIPRLLAHLDPAKHDDASMRPRWAVSALGRLCNAADVPRLGEQFEKGWTQVAAVFEDMKLEACVPYLVRALGRGQLTHDIGSACKAYATPKLRVAAVVFLERHGTRLEGGTGSLLEMLTTLRAVEALPAIVAIQRARESGAGDPLTQMNREFHDFHMGRALAKLGEPVGLELLIPLLGVSGHDKWMISEVGRTLNAVTGKSFWMEGGANDTALGEYERWWVKHRGVLEWDEKRRRYVVGN